MSEDKTTTLDWAQLRQLLSESFDDNELRDLCFDLRIDYESLPGDGKSAKARELVMYCDRHKRLDEFLGRLPAACKAIVTSRRRADIDARVVRLDRLERKDALDLMAELAKNNRHLQKATEQERGDLYEITNGNPLLIRWTVGQLGREGSHCRTIPEVCEFLKSAPPSGGNDPLEYIFGDLLDTFT